MRELIRFIIVIIIISISLETAFGQVINKKKAEKLTVLDQCTKRTLDYEFLCDHTSSELETKYLHLFGDPSPVSCLPSIHSGKLVVRLKIGLDNYEFGDFDNVYMDFTVSCIAEFHKVDNSGVVLNGPGDVRLCTLKINAKDGFVKPEDMYETDIVFASPEDDYSTMEETPHIALTNLVFDYDFDSMNSNIAQKLQDELFLEYYYTIEDRKIHARKDLIPDPNEEPIICINYIFGAQAAEKTLYVFYKSFAVSYSNKIQPIRLEWEFADDCVRDSIPNYHIQILKLENRNRSVNYFSDFVKLDSKIDWSKALNLYTGNSNQFIDVLLSQRMGFYLWRVRPVGSYFPGGIGNDLNYGKWNMVRALNYQNVVTIPCTEEYNPQGNTNIKDYEKLFAIAIWQYNSDLNWIYTKSFVEDKFAGTQMFNSISFYDNLLKPRQSQSLNLMRDNALVSEVYYDNIGRKLLSTLPVSIFEDYYWDSFQDLLPKTISGLYYKDGLITNSSGIPLNSNDFTSTGFTGITDGLLEDYYDGDNLLSSLGIINDGIPSAEGYPIARTIYMNDGSGRVYEQGGFGAALNRFESFNPVAGEQATSTRIYVSTASDDELIAIFGDEAPSENFVLKRIITDPNQVNSYEFFDLSGKTLATALKMNNENSLLDPLTGDPGLYKQNIIRIKNNERISENYDFLASRIFALINQQNNVYVDYTISVPELDIELCPELLFCYFIPFEIDLGLYQKNSNGGDLLPEELPALDNSFISQPFQEYPTCDDRDADAPIVYTKSWAFDGNPNGKDLLGSGKYEAKKYIRFDVSEIEQDFTDKVKTAVENDWNIEITQVSSLINSIMISTEPDLTRLFHVADDPSDTYELLDIGWVYNSEENIFTKQIGCCSEAKISIVTCEQTCEIVGSYEEYLKDKAVELISLCYDPYTTNFGDIDNETVLNSENISSYFWGDMNRDGDIEKIIPEISPYSTGGNGAFDALIGNMQSTIEYEDYEKDEFCDCWVNAVEMFVAQGTEEYIDASGNNVVRSDGSIVRVPSEDFNLLNAFLDCTGRKIKGISNHPYGGLGGYASETDINGLWDNTQTSQQYGKGYIDYAFEYFYYFPAFTNNISNLEFYQELCEENFSAVFPNFSFSATIPPIVTQSIDLDPDSFTSDEWNNFYQCVAATLPYDVVKSKIKEKKDEVDNDPFLSGVFDYVDLSHCLDPATGDIDMECVEEMVALLVDQCEDGCEERNFRASIIKLHRDNDYAIYDDKYFDPNPENNSCDDYIYISDWNPYPVDANGDQILNINHYLTEDAADDYVDILVAHCKGGCKLNIRRDNFGEIALGDLNARENFHNSMYADYELKLAGDDPPCPSYWTTLYDNQYSYDNTTLNIPTDIAYKKFIVDFLNMRLDYLIEGLEDYIPYNVNIIADEYAAESGDSLMRQVNCLLIKAAFDMLNDICTDQTLSFDECYSCETTDQFVNVVPRTEQHPWAIPENNPEYNHYTNMPYPHYSSFYKDENGLAFNEWVFFPKDKWINVETRNNCYNLETSIWKIKYYDRFVINNYYNNGELIDYLLLSRSFEYLDKPLNICKGFPTPQDYTFLCSAIEFNGGNPKLCFRWIDREYDEDNIEKVLTLRDCNDEIEQALINSLNAQMNSCRKELIKQGKEQIGERIAAIMDDPSLINEEFTVKYDVDYNHFTLFYYDRAGNLVQTVPPKGVDIDGTRTGRLEHPEHGYKSMYQYNSLGNVVSAKSPDEILPKEYFYDDFGRLRFSRDAVQKANAPPLISYVKYDLQNRVIEKGEIAYDETVFANGNPANDRFYPDPLIDRVSYTEYFYTKPFGAFKIPYENLQQDNLRNRLSYAVHYNNREGGRLPEPLGSHFTVATSYSYDLHGNIKWLVQEIPLMEWAMFQGQETFLPETISMKIDYEYDLISGNTRQVHYCSGRADQFHQMFEYDADNKISLALSSRNGKLWDRDNRYEYYPHGPLQRTVTGEDLITADDYYYTADGKLKAVNGGVQGYRAGINQDYGTQTAPDAFGYVLNYYENDFIYPVNPALLGSVDRLPGLVNLYNGNIASAEYAFDDSLKFYLGLKAPSTLNEIGNGYQYRYDYLNRLTRSKRNKYVNTWNAESERLKSAYHYDANGNIRTIFRGDNGGNSNDVMMNISGTNNQLISAVKGAGTVDYTYDDIGNLDTESSIGQDTYTNTMVWDHNGKIIRNIKSDLLPNIDCAPASDFTMETRFLYDASGTRVAKLTYSPELMAARDEISNCSECFGQVQMKGTYYIPDANNTVLAVYETMGKLEETTCMPFFWLDVREWFVYGSGAMGRIATVRPEKDSDNSTEYPDDNGNIIYPEAVAIASHPYFNFTPATNERQLGFKEYEYKDHLGNLRALIGDIKQPVNLNADRENFAFNLTPLAINNYYPFGLAQTWISANSPAYRFGFNGMEQDPEFRGEGKGYTTLHRLYDPDIARWLKLDPVVKPDVSGYISFGNNPIVFVDPMGLDENIITQNGKEAVWGVGKQGDEQTIMWDPYFADDGTTQYRKKETRIYHEGNDYGKAGWYLPEYYEIVNLDWEGGQVLPKLSGLSRFIVGERRWNGWIVDSDGYLTGFNTVYASVTSYQTIVKSLKNIGKISSLLGSNFGTLEKVKNGYTVYHYFKTLKELSEKKLYIGITMNAIGGGRYSLEFVLENSIRAFEELEGNIPNIGIAKGIEQLIIELNGFKTKAEVRAGAINRTANKIRATVNEIYKSAARDWLNHNIPNWETIFKKQ